MKLFLTQYIECKTQKLVTEGDEVPWDKDNVPFSPTKRRKLLGAFPEGLKRMNCLRFGGQCSSKHEKCRALRRACIGPFS